MLRALFQSRANLTLENLALRQQLAIAWHRQEFKLIWRLRSRTHRTGRPCIPREHRIFILHPAHVRRRSNSIRS
jgi:hypothetical protein